MTKTTEKIAVVALHGAYNVFTHGSHDPPSDVAAVLSLMPDRANMGLDCEVVFAQDWADVVTTPEGKVIDIRIALRSIGFLAVRNYCLTSGAIPPVMLQVFDDIEDPELCQIIDNENGVYLLPLLGEDV